MRYRAEGSCTARLFRHQVVEPEIDNYPRHIGRHGSARLGLPLLGLANGNVRRQLASGTLGLEAFLPSPERELPLAQEDLSYDDNEVPHLPLTPRWEDAQFSLLSVMGASRARRARYSSLRVASRQGSHRARRTSGSGFEKSARTVETGTRGGVDVLDVETGCRRGLTDGELGSMVDQMAVHVWVVVGGNGGLREGERVGRRVRTNDLQI